MMVSFNVCLSSRTKRLNFRVSIISLFCIKCRMKKIRWMKFNRKTHYWGAAVCSIPALIVIVTGILLLLKKQSDWIQPPTIKGDTRVPTLSFDEILTTSKGVEEAEISSWDDIHLLDVRPGKGLIKVRTKSSWEIQIDQQSGKVVSSAYRRSDLIESIHDGSFFHDRAKLWVFLPSALVMLVLWITGIYLFIKPLLARKK